MPTKCTDCQKGLIPSERRNIDRNCFKHTSDRRHRFGLQSVKIGKCGGGFFSIKKIFDLPRILRLEFPKLAQTVLQEDRSGGGRIWSLSVRSDVRAVDDVSRMCFKLKQDGLMQQSSVLSYALVANCLWDAACCDELKKHIKRQPDISLTGMREFLCEMEALIAKAHTKLGNPIGMAGAHSGKTWLRDLCHSAVDFRKYHVYVESLVPQLRKQGNGPSSVQTLWKGICKPENAKGQRLPVPGHTGIYYKMQTFRICRHAYHLVAPEFLWRDVLLKYSDGGANRKSGVERKQKATRFCHLMRQVQRHFCMCDLSCWICLT
jgi:hypothetical protein